MVVQSRDLHFQALINALIDDAKLRHSGGAFSAIGPFLPILTGLRLNIYAVAVTNPLHHVWRQDSLSLGHPHLQEKFPIGFHPVAQSLDIYPGTRRQLLSCHSFHNCC